MNDGNMWVGMTEILVMFLSSSTFCGEGLSPVDGATRRRQAVDDEGCEIREGAGRLVHGEEREMRGRRNNG